MKEKIYYYILGILCLISLVFALSNIVLDIESETEYVYVTSTSELEIEYVISEPIVISTSVPIIERARQTAIQSLGLSLDNQMCDLFDKYAPKNEYKINTKTGSEVYVCSHFGCDMAENLINAGYNAGVIINWNQMHALTWVELGDQVYVIEPQTRGKYWTVEDYGKGQNIDVVSLQKGREHAKSGSESLHR